MLREIDVYDFVVVGPSALWNGRAFGPRSGARSATRDYNEITTKVHIRGIQKWRQNLDFR